MEFIKEIGNGFDYTNNRSCINRSPISMSVLSRKLCQFDTTTFLNVKANCVDMFGKILEPFN